LFGNSVSNGFRDLTAVIANIKLLLGFRFIALLVNEILPNSKVLFNISAFFVLSWFERILNCSIHFGFGFLYHVVV
jgi:hypothetical protein